MTRSLPLSVWVVVLVLLDDEDLHKVGQSGILGKEWENDSFWRLLCTRRLALHGPEPTGLKDAYGQRVPYSLEAFPTKTVCEPSDSYKEWYLDAIKLCRKGQTIVFPSVLRGVYTIHIQHTAHYRHHSVFDLTFVQNGIHRKVSILTPSSAAGKFVCPEDLHMTQSGPACFLCSDLATITLERKLDVPVNLEMKLKSGRIDQPDGKVLVAACSCWGSWIDHRHIWCPLYSEESPFKQVMILYSCWWTNIYCLFNKMPSAKKYKCQWKVRCQKNGLYCGVKIFRHDPLRPVPIMVPVGFEPDLSVENEWDVWRDWYAEGKTSQTEGFLKLRREHQGPESCEAPLLSKSLRNWDKNGVLGEIEAPSTEDGLVDIQLSFTARPGIYSHDFVVDYFALTPVQ